MKYIVLDSYGDKIEVEADSTGVKDGILSLYSDYGIRYTIAHFAPGFWQSLTLAPVEPVIHPKVEDFLEHQEEAEKYLEGNTEPVVADEETFDFKVGDLMLFEVKTTSQVLHEDLNKAMGYLQSWWLKK